MDCVSIFVRTGVIATTPGVGGGVRTGQQIIKTWTNNSESSCKQEEGPWVMGSDARYKHPEVYLVGLKPKCEVVVRRISFILGFKWFI